MNEREAIKAGQLIRVAYGLPERWQLGVSEVEGGFIPKLKIGSIAEMYYWPENPKGRQFQIVVDNPSVSRVVNEIGGTPREVIEKVRRELKARLDDVVQMTGQFEHQVRP